MSDPIRSEIEREIADNTILVYGKGTKDAPLCGFTMETIPVLQPFRLPVRSRERTREHAQARRPRRDDRLADAAEVFIKGQFFGDTDILGPMAQNGELQTVLEQAFVDTNVKPTIQLH